jgi:TolA-binding protein
LALLISFLTVVLIYGLWQGRVEDAQKVASETMAKIDRAMPEVNLFQLQGQWGLDDPTDTRRIQTLEAIAKKYEEVALDSNGAASVEAWLKAGDTWLRVGNAEGAKGAYSAVLDAKDSGLLAVGARNGLAVVALGAKDNAEAMKHYRAIADKEDGHFAEGALLALAKSARAAGELGKANSALDELEKRYPDSLRNADIAWERERIAASRDQG